MTSFTRKLYDISPSEAVKLHRRQYHDYRYGKHVTLAQFTPSFRSETSESAPSYGHRAGLAAPSFGKRVSPPLMPAYECWAPELGKPRAIVRASDSFQARKEYARHHQIVVSDVAARRKCAMTAYELTTNEGTRLVRHNPRPNMLPYIKQKLAEGVPLAEIIYCWAPKSVS